MKGVLYCDSPVLNLCFEQVKRYCDARGIVPDIALKRLNCSGWTQEDQLTFGTLIFDLLQLFGDNRAAAAVRYTGDCLLGQNVLRVTMETGTGGGENLNSAGGRNLNSTSGRYHAGGKNQSNAGGRNHAGGQNQNLSKGMKKDLAKNRKLISDLEKDIRLVLAKYDGRIERADDSGQPEYVINWKDGAGDR